MMSKNKLLDRSECMTLLTTKAIMHWSFIKFIFNIPLVLTSSAMCIINSISTDANDIKVPNIVVNAISVLIMSLNASIKASEKLELFKKLSQSFMTLSQEIESIEGDDIDNDDYKLLLLKYDNLIKDCPFEEIPQKYKLGIGELYTKNNRYIPIQINGTVGMLSSKRDSKTNESSEVV